MGQGSIASLKDAWYRWLGRGTGNVSWPKALWLLPRLLWGRLFLLLDASLGSAPDVKLTNYLVIVGFFYYYYYFRETVDPLMDPVSVVCRTALQLCKHLSGIVHYSLLWERVHLFYLWTLLPLTLCSVTPWVLNVAGGKNRKGTMLFLLLSARSGSLFSPPSPPPKEVALFCKVHFLFLIRPLAKQVG